MLRATAGNWLNYSTTIGFQVLFARSYGASADASAFVAAFVLAISIGSIVSSTAQTIVLPRLLSSTGALRLASVKALLFAVAIAGLFCVALAAFSSPIAGGVAHISGAPANQSAHLLRYGAAFAFLAVLANCVSVVLLAKGQRFVPAFSPIFPTLLAAIWLFIRPGSALNTTFMVLDSGALIQTAIVFVFLLRHRVRLARDPIPTVSGLATATAFQFGLLSLLPLLERLMAGQQGAAGSVQYNYAGRALQGVQQLLIGGVMIARLADWSAPGFRHDRRMLRDSLSRSLIVTGALLVGAALIGAVLAPALVRLTFQRGSFTTTDTAIVARVLRLSLVGFVAEGLGTVLSQMLLAREMNRLAVNVGIGRFVLRVLLLIPAAVIWGVDGVAASYSATAVIILIVLGYLVPTRTLPATSPASRTAVKFRGPLALRAGKDLG